jgi:predicted RNA methylase
MKHWEDYWVNTKNKPLCEKPSVNVYGGTNYEPLASIGMSCFTDVIKDKFKEGFTIVDYGCGAGILSNFISERLSDFTYYGLEPATGWGPSRISLGRETFKDPRVNFGLIENDYDNIIKNNKIDAVILISVFTHLTIEDTYKVLDSLLNLFTYNQNASIVFSCFTENTPKLGHLQTNINSNYYSESYIKLEDLQTYCDIKKLNLRKHMDFIAMGGFNHEIFEITKL